MTNEALGARMSRRALDTIIAANLNQDSWQGLIGHDEYHFDNNAIEKTYRYINEQRGVLMASLLVSGTRPAWNAFGRLTHAVQDFYSHTNYIRMWLDQFNGAHLTPPEIDPVQKSLIESPSLYSARFYIPMDVLYFIPFLRKLSLMFLPHNSHGKMNLDSPAQGALFEYARVAAVKRTQHEFEILQKILTPDLFAKFVDL